MALDIKICGLKTVEAVEAALARGATHVGLIHFPKSPRHLEIDDMAALAERARGRGAQIVVVLVDPDDAMLNAVTVRVWPEMFQLHGSETPERVAFVSEEFGPLVMKAISVGSAADLAKISAYRPVADRILLDARKPKGSVLPGGNGVTFDWRLLAALDPSVPYMLSGGIDAENVGDALRRVRPAGIDVSSGVESAPGVKDSGLIHRFFDALEEARRTPEQERRAS